MRTKAIFLVFVFGTVAVRGEKEIVEEKESRIGSETGESNWKDFGNVLQLISKLEERIFRFFTITEKKFQGMEEIIDRRKKQAEDSLKKTLKIMEISVEAEQKSEMKKAKSGGKDETKIQECLDEEELDFSGEVDADYKDALDCIKYAAEEARNFLQDTKDEFVENFEDGLGEARKLAHRVQSCDFNSNSKCVRRMDVFCKKLKKTKDEGKFFIENARDALESQKEEMFNCRKMFIEELTQVVDGYTTLIKRCMIA